MTRSDSIGALVAALAKAQAQIEGAVKDALNPHFKSKYADLASVWDACREPLTKNGLAVLQPVSADGSKVTVTTLLTHTSGEWIAEALTLTATQDTPQGVGSAITYGRRYGLSSMVGIAPEDDDGNAASKPSAQIATQARQPASYDDWLLDMTACASEGETALKAAWTRSSIALREWITTHDAAEWVKLKERAKKADAAVLELKS